MLPIFYAYILTEEMFSDNTIIDNRIISNTAEDCKCRYVIQALTQGL